MDIVNFYDNREIFITGGTGFLGKSLIEKLLRDVTGITKFYMLIRPKKGKTAADRLKDFKNDAIFERLRRERPNAFEKIVPIFGDCLDIGLGISKEDLERLKNVSVIFHEAADVRFDSDLRNSILMNTRGTHELVKIALTLKKLVAFVHVSTAYIYPLGNDIEEKIYNLPNDWRKTIQMAETYDWNTLEILRMKYTNYYPNAYSFTKNLSEQIINDYSRQLPVTIVRPCVVSPSYKEPEPGYFDNLNGPVGLLTTILLGIGQMVYCNPDLNLSLIPVDIITCLTIAAGCKLGLETLKVKNPPITIRNLAPRSVYRFTLQQSAAHFVRIAKDNPLQYVVWAPESRMTTNMYWYLLWVFVIHIPIALFYDTLLRINKKDPVILKTQRRLIFTARVLSTFVKKYFNFHNEGFWELLNYTLEHDERRLFSVLDHNKLDIDTLFKGMLRGLKKFMFNEPLEATPSTRQRYKFFIYLNEIVKLILLLTLFKLAWNWIK